MQFSSLRLSPHYTLLDFMNARTVYTSGKASTVDDIPAPMIATGRKFCEEFLEPLRERHGPLSFSSGYIPKYLLKRWTPHSWAPEDGAAADVIVHNWVNSDLSPMALVASLVRSGVDFERMITYAGSEVICMSSARNSNRRAIYENVRVPGEKPSFITWARGPKSIKNPEKFRPEARANWRRLEGEPIYHAMRNLRAQHIRVGGFFTLLDFFRDEEAMATGKAWVPVTDHLDAEPIQPIIGMARCMAEVLDPYVERWGHVTVVQGARRRDLSTRESEHWAGRAGFIKILIPEDKEPVIPTHPMVAAGRIEKHPAGHMISFLVRRFEPYRMWTSAVDPTKAERDRFSFETEDWMNYYDGREAAQKELFYDNPAYYGC